MLSITREWVLKAESDYDVVLLLLHSRKPSRHDPTCFHAQQCVEKYLKGRLTEAGIPFPKTHDLDMLLNLALTIEPRWSTFSGSFITLPDRLLGQPTVSREISHGIRSAHGRSDVPQVSEIGPTEPWH